MDGFEQPIESITVDQDSLQLVPEPVFLVGIEGGGGKPWSVTNVSGDRGQSRSITSQKHVSILTGLLGIGGPSG